MKLRWGVIVIVTREKWPSVPTPSKMLFVLWGLAPNPREPLATSGGFKSSSGYVPFRKRVLKSPPPLLAPITNMNQASEALALIPPTPLAPHRRASQSCFNTTSQHFSGRNEEWEAVKDGWEERRRRWFACGHVVISKALKDCVCHC